MQVSYTQQEIQLHDVIFARTGKYLCHTVLLTFLATIYTDNNYVSYCSSNYISYTSLNA